jgi:hypothetical protein
MKRLGVVMCRQSSTSLTATSSGRHKIRLRAYRGFNRALGKANITAFFESLAPLKITRFEPHTFFESGDKILVLIAFEAVNREKNYSFPNNGHLWQFNAAGKVARYDHITDTAQMIRMAKGE